MLRFLMFLMSFLLFLFTTGKLSAQNVYPGGVIDAELWYKSDLEFGSYMDYSGNDIAVSACNDYVYNELFNFNPSMYGSDLCFQNYISLEQSVSRHQFIVADLETIQDNYALSTTSFNHHVLPSVIDSSSVNTYVIHTQDTYASKLLSEGTVQNNAVIYTSNWDQYAQTHKFKQYGLEGESWNILGKSLSSNFIDDADKSFHGDLPEFVCFNRNLSRNEETRVASYLALKYGISLDRELNYLDSKNQKFWNKENNTHFPNRIFGVGKDVLSDLYQSQAESRHAQDYIVFGLESIYPRNTATIVGNLFNDREFITIGDTGGRGFSSFQDNIKKHNRTWLVQLTGKGFSEKHNHLRVNLDELLDPNSQEYTEVLHGEMELRLLHDPYAINTQVSEFDHSEVNYIRPSSITTDSNGVSYADFVHVLPLDEDLSKFHQFTFVIVDEVIVKFKPIYDCEEARFTQIDCYEVAIIVEEGNVENIQVNHPEVNGFIEADYSPYYTNQFGKPTFTFLGCVGEYDIIVHSAGGRQFQYTYDLVPKGSYHIDLGPSVQYLDANQPIIELNANGNINDPEAIFKWYKNDVLIEHSGYANFAWSLS